MQYQSPVDPNLARAPYPLVLPRSPSRWPWLLTALVTGLAGYGAYWGYGERERLLAQLELSRGEVRTAHEATKALEAQVATVQAEKAAREEERAALIAARDDLAKSVEQKSSELAELKGTTDKLREQMKDEIAQGDIQLTESGGKLRVGLVDKILFESGEASISKRGEGVLQRVGAILASIDDRQIQVSGHTDNTPISDKLKQQYPTNWDLSVARATNVVRFLQEKASVSPERLVASGHGEYDPIASNRTATGRAKNRRIELLLTPTLAPKRISKVALKERADDKKAVAKSKKKSRAR